MPDKIRHFYEFAEFRLDAQNQALWRGGELVSIPPKALETLILLVENNGRIVSREQLLEAVWKDTFVEEGNINYTISLLRKTLGKKDLILTVPRRGYLFKAEVAETAPGPVQLEKAPAAPAEKFSRRWIFAASLLIGVLFLTSFAVWWHGSGPPVEPPVPVSEAMQAYTRGKMILGNRTVENREEKAIDEFQQAIALDPTLAVAYVGLAEGFSATAVKTDFPQSRDYYAKASAAAEKALALDPNLAEGFLVRGWLKRQGDWDWTGAEADLRNSIRLNSKNASAHHRLALLLSSLGRHDEALAEFRRAYELDPIGDYILAARFPILEARRDYAEALRESEQFQRENKNNPAARRAYATFLYHTRNYAKVIELGEETLARENGSFGWFSLLSAAYARTGQPEKAADYLQRIEALAENDTKAAYSLAMNYSEANRSDEALAALRKCFEKREERMVWLNVEPRFENLWPDPRFVELVRQMGFSR